MVRGLGHQLRNAAGNEQSIAQKAGTNKEECPCRKNENSVVFTCIMVFFIIVCYNICLVTYLDLSRGVWLI